MDLKNYYRILGVNQDASSEDIKKAFRRLALQHHPDRNLENTAAAEAKFKEINEAYEVLGEEERKWQYDSLVSLSNTARRTIFVNNPFNGDIDSESVLEILRKLTGTGFVMGRTGCGKSQGCGRCQGGQCRRQWRQEID